MLCKSYKDGYCMGTKEVEICNCEGYEERCSFYEEVRKRGMDKLREENKRMRAKSWHYCPYCGRELK